MSADPTAAPTTPLSRTAENDIKAALAARRFFWTVEFIPSVDKVLRDELQKLGGVADAMQHTALYAGFAVTDRVVSDRDPDPVSAAAHLFDASGKQPLVHLSGKGRDIADYPALLTRVRDLGLANLLILTGDRLKEEPADGRARYLESVPAIRAARQFDSQLLIAVALNPFKYREEDGMAQYLKLGKKVSAGANLAITQIGWDICKYGEALGWVRERGYDISLMANVMPLTAARARYMRRNQLAGVTITDSLLALLEQEEKMLADRGLARALRRLALQVIGVRHMGYAGVQITGIHAIEKLDALAREIDSLASLADDAPMWERAWQEALALPEGGRAETAPRNGWYLDDPIGRKASVNAPRYHAMHLTHRVLFDKGPVAALLGALCAPIKPRHGLPDRLLAGIERALKAPLFGCENCGMCRLAATQYVCPETCPKGLANGPCGGTSENLCEFRDRECIHSVKYRIARDAGVLDELETLLVPAVPSLLRGSASWPPHFRGETPLAAKGDAGEG